MKIYTVCISLFLFSCANESNLHPVCPHRCYAFPGVSQGIYSKNDSRRLSKTKNVGVCQEGFAVCDERFIVIECSGEVLPNAEICDGLDNDCDGYTDEYINLNRYHENYQCMINGVCNYATVSCTNGIPVCHYPQDLYEPSVETRCDGLDNDCDGRGDEDLFFGQYCYDGPVGTESNLPCHPGVLKCIDGSIVCENQFLPTSEICDDVDNNCDGIVDNIEGRLQNEYDIVFIIDTSGSMCPYISAVSGALDAYSQQFNGNTNYKFALVLMAHYPGPYVFVDTNFSDFSIIKNRILFLACNGYGNEASLDSMLMVCDSSNLLYLNWRSSANRLFFAFTDEPAQTHLKSDGTWCYKCGLTTAQNVIDVCLQSYTLPFIWGRLNDPDFVSIAQGANGIYFNLTNSWEQMFDDMNSIIIVLCESGGTQ